MSGAPLGVVFLGKAGQPEAEGQEGDAADLLAAVVQPLQQVCGDKSRENSKKNEAQEVRVQLKLCQWRDLSVAVTWVDLVEDVRVQAGSCELQDDGHRATSKHSARLRVFIQGGEHQRDELLLQTQQLTAGNTFNGWFSFYTFFVIGNNLYGQVTAD